MPEASVQLTEATAVSSAIAWRWPHMQPHMTQPHMTLSPIQQPVPCASPIALPLLLHHLVPLLPLPPGVASHCLQVIVSGKLRAQRAKSMKFKDGYMVSSGDPTRVYIDGAVRHVMLRQGVLGIKVCVRPSTGAYRRCRGWVIQCALYHASRVSGEVLSGVSKGVSRRPHEWSKPGCVAQQSGAIRFGHVHLHCCGCSWVAHWD